MGNTVSAAELAAAQIIHPNVEAHKDNIHKYSGEIPPECPMHRQRASECPVQHGKDDVNPLNMVQYHRHSLINNL